MTKNSVIASLSITTAYFFWSSRVLWNRNKQLIKDYNGLVTKHNTLLGDSSYLLNILNTNHIKLDEFDLIVLESVTTVKQSVIDRALEEAAEEEEEEDA